MKTKSADIPYCGVDPRRIESATPIFDVINLRRFIGFIKRRYLVHIRKDVQGLPLSEWTTDPILQQYRFTNVRREHDTQTKWLIEHIATNPCLTLEDKIVNCFMFRAWNNYKTMEFFDGPWWAGDVYSGNLKEQYRPKYLHELHLEKGRPKGHQRKWWSSAYNQGGTKYAWKFPDGEGFSRAKSEAEGAKHADYEPDIPLRPFHIGPWLKEYGTVSRLLHAKSQQDAFNVIKEIRGFSTFLAYQVFVDLTYIPEFPFSENEFVVAGPGCVKGLAYLFDDADDMTAEEQIFWLRDHFSELCAQCGINVYRCMTDLPEYDRDMNVMSLENCLCEISKYIRAVEGTGRPRKNYKPAEEQHYE